MGRTLKFGLALAGLALLVATAALASSNRSTASDTRVFATESEPTFLDPAIVSDGPSLRVADQLFEGLVGVAPGSTKIVPALARS
jgi:peptide/nickel transport system substrate-binding protein